MKVSKSIVDVVLLALIAVWAISIVWDMTHKDYEPPTGVYEMAMLAAGFLFGGRRFLNGNGNSNADVRNNNADDDRVSVPDSRIRPRPGVVSKDALEGEFDRPYGRHALGRHGRRKHDAGGGMESQGGDRSS